jgi:hypothetical protein
VTRQDIIDYALTIVAAVATLLLYWILGAL